jgi:acetyl-CoA synthetase
MYLVDPTGSPADRAARLNARYSDVHASAAFLLCDQHDPEAVAYTVIGSDLSSVDLTYGALRAESERFAAALSSLGIRAGDRVATLMGKSRAHLVTIVAILRLGAVHVPLFTAFAPPAIAFRLRASHCRLVVCDAAQRHKLAPGETMPTDPPWIIIESGSCDSDTLSYDVLVANGRSGYQAAALGGAAPIIQIYTSGTTGQPKGVMVPLRAVAGFQIYAEYALGLRTDDVFWNAADPGWGYGLYVGIIASFATGVRGILFEGGFSAQKYCSVLATYGVTNFTAAPTLYRSLRASGVVPSSRDLRIRSASSAGEPLTPEVNDWAVEALGVPVFDHYGQTETGMLINNHHHPALRRPLKIGSMGQVQPGWKAVILKPDQDEPAGPGEPGRVAMDLTHSPLAWFAGYVDAPEKSAEKFSADGRWYITGDTGRMDEEGYCYFSARDDDVIIMAGYRIGPFEVESVLVTHPAVIECAVIAVPDAIRGEALHAVVVLREDRSPSEALTSELQDWVKVRYAAHAYPRRVHYADSLPKTPSGKIQRFVLRQQMRERPLE